MTDPIDPVRQEIVIAAPPERVFDAWTDPEEIPGWYVERQEGDPREDERIVWFISREERVLATTPRGAVVAFSEIRGVFAFMGVGGAVVWASVWGDGDLERAKAKAEDLAERLAARVVAA